VQDDQFRISEFKKALRQDVLEGVVDLDKNYPYKFNVQIHRYEDILRNSRMAAPPNRWSYYRFCLVTEGEGDLVAGIFKFKARKNTLYIIPSRVISSSRNWTSDTQGFVLLFNIDFFLQNNFSHQFILNKKILTSSIQPFIHLTDEQTEEFTRIFESILVERKSREVVNYELIAVKILELLILSERLFEQTYGLAANLPYIDIINQFVELLEIHFAMEHSVRFYADRLAIHPNHLNALIKKQTGFSAKESIQNKLLLEIKYLLHATKLPIKQISNQMGFNDPNYFTTFFKKAENISPVSYRTTFD
jgi:AraC family transcriptional activator of pobA